MCSDDGAVVIDNSSAFRYMKDIALCVPEINADAARKSKKKVCARVPLSTHASAYPTSAHACIHADVQTHTQTHACIAQMHT